MLSNVMDRGIVDKPRAIGLLHFFVDSATAGLTWAQPV